MCVRARARTERPLGCHTTHHSWLLPREEAACVQIGRVLVGVLGQVAKESAMAARYAEQPVVEQVCRGTTAIPRAKQPRRNRRRHHLVMLRRGERVERAGQGSGP